MKHGIPGGGEVAVGADSSRPPPIDRPPQDDRIHLLNPIISPCKFFKEEEMASLTRSLRAKSLLLLAVVLMLTLAACGGSSNTGGGGSTSTKVPITVGSKLDPEAQLLGEMYILLLQKA